MGPTAGRPLRRRLDADQWPGRHDHGRPSVLAEECEKHGRDIAEIELSLYMAR